MAAMPTFPAPAVSVALDLPIPAGVPGYATGSFRRAVVRAAALSVQGVRPWSLSVPVPAAPAGRPVPPALPALAAAPAWAVPSATVATTAHLVWVEDGRLRCTCPARSYTCWHAQLVRLSLLAARAARPPAPARRPAPAPAPAPSAPAPSVPAPSVPVVAATVPPVAPEPAPVAAPAEAPAEAPAPGQPARAGLLPDGSLACRGCHTAPALDEEGLCDDCYRLAHGIICGMCGCPADADTAAGLRCQSCLERMRASEREAEEARRAHMAAANARSAAAARAHAAREDAAGAQVAPAPRRASPRTRSNGGTTGAHAAPATANPPAFSLYK